MTLEEMAMLTTIISATRPGLSFADKTRIKAWHILLCDLDFKIVNLAVGEILRTVEKDLDINPALIRRVYSDILQPEVDTQSAVDVLNTVLSFGRYRYNEAMEYLEEQDPIISQIIKGIGFMNLCNADCAKIRKDFEFLYSQTMKNHRRDKMLPDDIKQKISKVKFSLEQQHYKALECTDNA